MHLYNIYFSEHYLMTQHLLHCSYRYVMILRCILVTRQQHILTSPCFTSRPTFLLAWFKVSVFSFMFLTPLVIFLKSHNFIISNMSSVKILFIWRRSITFCKDDWILMQEFLVNINVIKQNYFCADKSIILIKWRNWHYAISFWSGTSSWQSP
jgi:hypothetical protein